MLSSIVTLSVFTLTLQSTSTSSSTSLFSVVNLKSPLVPSPLALHNNQNYNQLRWSRIPARASEFKQGQRAEYYSESNGRWVPCRIQDVDAKGAVQIDVKKGYWIDVNTQKGALRKLNPIANFFQNSDFDFGGNSYGKGKGDITNNMGTPDDYVEGSMAKAYAEAREARKKFAQESGRKSVFSQVVGALDFQENIKADRGLLKGASQLKKGEKMTDEQYGAVRRKIGGTKGGFFGETVEAKGAYVDKGYVPDDQGDGANKPWWKNLR